MPGPTWWSCPGGTRRPRLLRVRGAGRSKHQLVATNQLAESAHTIGDESEDASLSPNGSWLRRHSNLFGYLLRTRQEAPSPARSRRCLLGDSVNEVVTQGLRRRLRHTYGTPVTRSCPPSASPDDQLADDKSGVLASRSVAACAASSTRSGLWCCACPSLDRAAQDLRDERPVVGTFAPFAMRHRSL